MKKMNQVKKILTLSDPYPNLWYEFFCYAKTALGTLFFLLGLFLIFHPFFFKINFGGILETGLSPVGLQFLDFLGSLIYPKGYAGFFLWGIIFLVLSICFFSRIKLIRKLLLN